MANLLDRRSFMKRLGVTTTIGALATLTGGTARAWQVSDQDSGAYADPAGAGRGSGGTGMTDTDGGQYADGVGNGRGANMGITDNDAGQYADPYGYGRGQASPNPGPQFGGPQPIDGGKRLDDTGFNNIR